MLPFRSGSVIAAKISDTRPKSVRQKLDVSSVEKATHTKDAQIEKKSNQSVLTVKDHMLLTVKGVQLIKNRCSVNMAPPPQLKGDTFSFTADQLIKFVATVAIQIAQPQVCYSNAPKDTVDRKPSLCRRVSETAKSQLGIIISESTLFDAIGSVRAPVLPAPKIPVVILEPFRFSTSTKPSTILNSLNPSPPPNRTSPVGHLS